MSSCGRRSGAYSQDPGDLARTDPLRGQLDHFLPLGLWQRSAVEEHPSELVDASTTLLCQNKIYIQSGMHAPPKGLNYITVRNVIDEFGANSDVHT